MNRGSMLHKSMLIMGIVLISLTATLLTGCGGSAPEPKTEPVEVVTPVETIPDPVVTEPVTPEVVTPDYGSMDPAEYGIEDVYFAFDQYDLDNESMAILASNARAIREARQILLISGHCDERGTIEYNLALGEKRANAVRDYLISLGVPAQILRITSYGENKPFARGHNEDAWAQNRRAHFERP